MNAKTIHTQNKQQTIRQQNTLARYKNKALDYLAARKNKHETKPEPAVEHKKVRIALDCYDDIFSDFDARVYREREISEDLLKELGARCFKLDGSGIEIVFSLPESLRRKECEEMICERLNAEFEHRLEESSRKAKRQKRKGATMFFVGSVLLLCEELIAKFYGETGFLKELAYVFLTPAGWYGAFMGIEHIHEIPEQLKQEKKLFSKLGDCKITFCGE